MDEVSSVAGQQGQPDKVAARKRQGRRRRLKGERGRARADKAKPPVLGMLERAGQILLTLLGNVQQKTLHPVREHFIAKNTLIYTDEYNIYDRLTTWGYDPKTVCHAKAEYARDEDGDGFCEVHVTTLEGFWSLLRSWLRPHRGSSQQPLPWSLGFFECVHHLRTRGKALLPSLLQLLLAP